MQVQESARNTWNIAINIVKTIWTKFYSPSSSFLALTHREAMPRTRRRHHSRDRSTGVHRDKRRRVGSEETTPPLIEAPSPPRTRYTRSDAKKRRHDSDANSRVSNKSIDKTKETKEKEVVVPLEIKDAR